MVAPDFRSKTVYLDAAPLIYYIEEHPTYLPKLDPIFWQSGQGQIRVVTSVISLLEVLVGPFKHGLRDLAHVYREIKLKQMEYELCLLLLEVSAG